MENTLFLEAKRESLPRLFLSGFQVIFLKTFPIFLSPVALHFISLKSHYVPAIQLWNLYT